MRPGPATRAASLVECSARIHRLRRWDVCFRNHILGNAVSGHTLHVAGCKPFILRWWLATRDPQWLIRASGSVLPFQADHLRRPQRPGTGTRKARFWKPSCRFTLENRQVPPALPQSRQRFRTSHACTDDTVKQSRLPCNGKLAPSCAEAVEDRNSLWKEKEN